MQKNLNRPLSTSFLSHGYLNLVLSTEKRLVKNQQKFNIVATQSVSSLASIAPFFALGSHLFYSNESKLKKLCIS